MKFTILYKPSVIFTREYKTFLQAGKLRHSLVTPAFVEQIVFLPRKTFLSLPSSCLTKIFLSYSKKSNLLCL